MIIKSNGQYIVKSKSTGRSFGVYPTRTQAEYRLKQIEFFKHLRKIKK